MELQRWKRRNEERDWGVCSIRRFERPIAASRLRYNYDIYGHYRHCRINAAATYIYTWHYLCPIYSCLMNITNNILVLCALPPFLFSARRRYICAASLTARNAPNRSYMPRQCRVYIRRLFPTIHAREHTCIPSICVRRRGTQKFQVSAGFLCAASGKSLASVSSCRLSLSLSRGA